MDTEGVSDEREGARERERERTLVVALQLLRSPGASLEQTPFKSISTVQREALSLGGFPANDLNFGTCFPDF